ncbi:fibronectin type III domain-containing protein [Herbiconiux solani]|uniref:fibronectin type III domain-containing protein n=1 Tax=Herbiconiux solani TaxID=661329 RepID=UPI000825C3DB|nr:fibronectin type III domain-containing protein [Herbiconiux solani]
MTVHAIHFSSTIGPGVAPTERSYVEVYPAFEFAKDSTVNWPIAKNFEFVNGEVTVTGLEDTASDGTTVSWVVRHVFTNGRGGVVGGAGPQAFQFKPGAAATVEWTDSASILLVDVVEPPEFGPTFLEQTRELRDETAGLVDDAQQARDEAAAFGGTNNAQVAGMLTGAGPSRDALNSTIQQSVGPLVSEAIANDSTIVARVDDAVAAAASGLITAGPAITPYGTSITQGVGGQTPWPAQLSALSGRTVKNRGIGGESSIGIVARQGGLPYQALPAGGEISATATPVTVALSVIGDGFSWPLLQGPTSVTGTLVVGAKRIPGTLAIVKPSGNPTTHLSDDYYTFTRTTAGTAIAATRPSAFYWATADADKNDIQVWDFLENYISETWWTTRGLADLKAAENALTSASKRFLITTPVGSPSAAKTALIGQLIATYGRRVIDVRSYLISYGLADAGLTPDAEDLSDIAAGNIPHQLRIDGIHLTTAALGIYARLIYERMIELGWLPPAADTVPAAPTGLALSNATKSTADAAWNPSTGAISYQMRYRKTGDTAWLTGPATALLTATIASLADGTQYDVQIAAVNAIGTGAYSATQTISTIASPLLSTAVGVAPALAFSRRKVVAGYSGPAYRLRRSSDNAEMDIGFVGSNPDDATAIAWLAGAGGYVVKWYDQSAGAHHFTAPTAAAQPPLFTAGALITKGPQFDGTRALVGAALAYALGSATYLLVANGGQGRIFSENRSDETASQYSPLVAGSGVLTRFIRNAANATIINVSTAGPAGFDASLSPVQHQFSAVDTGSAFATYVDAAAGQSNSYTRTGTLNPDVGAIGAVSRSGGLSSFFAFAGSAGSSAPGNIAELVIFPGALSDTARHAGEANQKTYYETP